jgi:polysaccharide export outer membrane protein
MIGQSHTITSLVITLTIAAGIGRAQSPSNRTVPSQAPPTYVLGSGDQVMVQLTPGGEDVNGKLWRIDEAGDLTVPMAGTAHAAGLTTHGLADVLTERYGVFFRAPQVIVSVSEMRSQPVSVMGAVNTPGVHQLQGHRTLVEVLALAGGLRADAGYRVKITRRGDWGTIPLAGAVTSEEGVSVAEVALKGLMEAADPSQNIAIMPEDVLTVPVAEMVYVIGDVHKSGGFILGERRQISVLEALALSEGLGPSARAEQARILRANEGADSRTELSVDLKKILAGQANDVTMQSNDILFVPVNGAQRLGVRALEQMLTIGSGLAIYRP